VLPGTADCTANTKIVFSIAIVVARDNKVRGRSPVDVLNTIVGGPQEDELSLRGCRRIRSLNTKVVSTITIEITRIREEVTLNAESPWHKRDISAWVSIAPAIIEKALAVRV